MNQHFNNSLTQLKYSISAGKKVYGIFGSPVEHSLSPLMHNEAFRLKGINAEYIPFLVNESDIEEAFSIVKKEGISGLNITLPLKQRIIPYLDSISPDAKKIGAVNTVIITGRKSKGYNTDIRGFLAPLKAFLSAVKYENAVVIGDGGVSRTVLYGLLKHCSFPLITLISLYEDIGNALLDDAEVWKSGETTLQWVSFHSRKEIAEILWSSKLIVNCTPLGMSGYNEDFPEHFYRFLRPGQIIYDLVYTPLKTKLLQEAEKHGAVTISGLDMLIEQGAESFKIWTKQKMPKKDIRKLLLSKLVYYKINWHHD